MRKWLGMTTRIILADGVRDCFEADRVEARASCKTFDLETSIARWSAGGATGAKS